MTRADELLALADKAESYVASRLHDIARDQERDLHEAIARAVGVPCTVSVGHSVLGNVRKVPARLPAYTASLDSALTLVGKNAFWRLGNDGEGPDVTAFKATVTSGNGPHDFAFHDAVAATPALALCAAALRALAAIETGAAA